MAGFNTLSAEELEQTDPDKSQVVTRDEHQGYTLSVYDVSPTAVETEAFTYSQDCGMYRLTNTEATLATELASILKRIGSENKTIGAVGPAPHEAFEVVVETTDTVDSTDITESSRTSVEVQVSTASPFATELDDLLEVLRSHVKDE